jgi:hypothetical protein
MFTWLCTQVIASLVSLQNISSCPCYSALVDISYLIPPNLNTDDHENIILEVIKFDSFKVFNLSTNTPYYYYFSENNTC